MRENGKLYMLIVTWFLIVLFCSVNVFAQNLGSPAQETAKPKQEILFSENGRFVFGQISDSGKDQFMLDTATGRLWRIAETGEIGMFLRPVPYRNDEGEISPVPEEIIDR